MAASPRCNLLWLNAEQRAALSHFFSPTNQAGEPHPEGQPFRVRIHRGQLEVNGCWLQPDGEWATYAL